MSKKIEVSKEAVIEFRRLRDEIAMLRGLIKQHNAKCTTECLGLSCSVFDQPEMAVMCGGCPKEYLIDLSEVKT